MAIKMNEETKAKWKQWREEVITGLMAEAKQEGLPESLELFFAKGLTRRLDEAYALAESKEKAITGPASGVTLESLGIAERRGSKQAALDLLFSRLTSHGDAIPAALMVQARKSMSGKAEDILAAVVAIDKAMSKAS